MEDYKAQVLADEVDKYKTVIFKQLEEIERLENTLIEIKGIASAISSGTHFTDNIEEHLKELARLIQTKIDEVLG